MGRFNSDFRALLSLRCQVLNQAFAKRACPSSVMAGHACAPAFHGTSRKTSRAWAEV
ncbi:hypothetical protein EMIT047CA2_40048 [Pseudomonas soli]